MAKEAKVVHKISDESIVINMGSNDGIMVGNRFFIYGLGDEIHDGDVYLEKLELAKGIGVAIHVQSKITTLDSDTYIEEGTTTEVIKPESPFSRLSYLGVGYSEKRIIHPKKIKQKFDKVNVGDFARLLE